MHFADLDKALPSNRRFGVFFTAIFAGVGVWLLSRGSSYSACLCLGLSVVFLVVAMLKESWLLELNRLWMRFGLLVGMMVSPVVLGAFFFGPFTLVSLLMRLFGRDELRLGFEARISYWRERDGSQVQGIAFENQF